MCDQKVAVTEGFVYPKSVTADNHSKRGKHSFLNNGGTRDLKRNEPRRDCDLSPNLVGSACNALFSALEPKRHVIMSCLGIELFVQQQHVASHLTHVTSGP